MYAQDVFMLVCDDVAGKWSVVFLSPRELTEPPKVGRAAASDAEPSVLGGCHRLTGLKRPRFERPAPAEALRAGGLADPVGRAAACLRRSPYVHGASAGPAQCTNATTLKDVGHYGCGKARCPV